MRGFGSFESAARFCPAADEVRHYFRYRKRMGETVRLAEQRRVFRQRWDALQAGLMAAYSPQELLLLNVDQTV
jgi:hypothetical protein